MTSLDRARPSAATTRVLAALSAAILAACSGGDGGTTTGPPPPGSISVSVTQHGNGHDADGFIVAASGVSQAVQLGVPVTLAPISAGAHAVSISGLGGGCSADADTVMVTVVSGQTSNAQFSVGCFGGIAFGVQNASDDVQVLYLGEDGSLTPLTSGTSKNILEDFAPDGSRVLFTSDRGGSKDLYTVKTDGTGTLRLTTDPRDVITARWSPDGSKIVFWRQAIGGAEPFSMYVIDANGANEHLVLDLLHDDFDPAWSSDGLSIIFSCNRYGHFWDLCQVAPDGGGLHRVLYSSGAQHSRTSPAGGYVGFQSYEGTQSIWVANLADTSRVNLTPGISSFDFAWAPDGSKLIVGVYDGVDYLLERVNRDGTGLAPITPVSDEAGEGRWSPDGARVAYTSQRTGTQEIWVMKPDGSDVHRVTPLGGGRFRPMWNPTAHPAVDVAGTRRILNRSP